MSKIKKMSEGGLDKTSQELEDLLPSREKIGSALRSKIDPQTVADMAMPQAAVARRIADSAKDISMPLSYEEKSSLVPSGIMGHKKGGKVKSASARADGCCIRGKTRA
jgi:hypothetical protein